MPAWYEVQSLTTGFPLFWKKKIQEFSDPILEFYRWCRS